MSAKAIKLSGLLDFISGCFSRALEVTADFFNEVSRIWKLFLIIRFGYWFYVYNISSLYQWHIWGNQGDFFNAFDYVFIWK